MVSFTKLSLATTSLFSLATADAPVIESNPSDVTFTAHLYNGPANGTIKISTADNGEAQVYVSISGLPSEGGPFVYHIHENEVAEDGTGCGASGGHLDPYNATITACNASFADSVCQVGDLSGKHGAINGTSYEATYIDPYLSLDSSNEAYVGGRSIVVHYKNLTKLACGNLYKSTASNTTSDNSTSSDSSDNSSNSSNSTSSSAASISEGAANKLAAGTLGAFLALVVSFF